jgi:FlaA1/EpsC-like NDP-sugar epimerase
LFEKCGFEVLDVRSEYDQQYLIIEARHTSREITVTPWADENKIHAAQLVKGFQKAYDETMSPWKQLMKEQATNPKKIVVWGSGSKGVSFLTRLKIFSEIEYVVDINPHRQKTYMAGTGQLVVAPSFLKEYKPDLVVIMNPIYKNEIVSDLNSMGLNPEIQTLGMNAG